MSSQSVSSKLAPEQTESSHGASQKASRKDVLLLSAGGMVGRAWAALAEKQGLTFDVKNRPELDYAKPESLRALPFADYTLVVNCAAYTDVDGAEADEATATAVNGDAVAVLAQSCAAAGTTLLHYSTDYVFSGQATAPYPVEEPHAPLNAYGRSKAKGEVALAASGTRHLLLRTSWVYAPWGKNFLLTIDRAASQKAELRVVNDQHGRPTSAEHLADASWRLFQAGGAGTYHVCDGGHCSWFEFAQEIVRLRGHACRVEPCTSAEYPRPAARPAYSVMDLSRAEDALGLFPSWQTNVAAALACVPR